MEKFTKLIARIGLRERRNNEDQSRGHDLGRFCNGRNGTFAGSQKLVLAPPSSSFTHMRPTCWRTGRGRFFILDFFGQKG